MRLRAPYSGIEVEATGASADALKANGFETVKKPQPRKRAAKRKEQ